MGTYIPPVRSGVTNPPGMVEGDRMNRENQAVDLHGWIANPVRTQTPQTRFPPVRGLLGPKPDNGPKSIPAPTDAGVTRPSTRGAMVHKKGPQKWVSSNPNEKRGRVEDHLLNLLRTIQIPSHTLWLNKCAVYVSRYDEPYLI